MVVFTPDLINLLCLKTHLNISPVNHLSRTLTKFGEPVKAKKNFHKTCAHYDLAAALFPPNTYLQLQPNLQSSRGCFGGMIVSETETRVWCEPCNSKGGCLTVSFCHAQFLSHWLESNIFSKFGPVMTAWEDQLISADLLLFFLFLPEDLCTCVLCALCAYGCV